MFHGQQFATVNTLMNDRLTGRDAFSVPPNREIFQQLPSRDLFDRLPDRNALLDFRRDPPSYNGTASVYDYEHLGFADKRPAVSIPYSPPTDPYSSTSSRQTDRDSERERERDRSRRESRDKQRTSRREGENWERSGRRERADREGGGPRERRRERRSSREKGQSRDRSPLDEDSMDVSDDSRLGAASDDDYASGSPKSQGRERSRDRDRSKRDYDDDRDHRHEDRDRSYGGDGERWMTESPSATILLRGLTNAITENDVITELVHIGLPPKDVRFMRRVTGASRGFGFVEFQTESEAQRWMDHNQGVLSLPGINQRVTMHFSAPRVGRDVRDSGSRMDWMCKCGAHNFKRRDFCYKCNTNRRIAEDPLGGVTELDGGTHVGKNPCNTLIFRDLDALTTEQGILQAIAALTSMPVKNAHVVRDEMNTSRCFAFVELNSVAEAKQLCEFILALIPPLAIDGKQILTSYAKNTFNTSLDIIRKAQQKVMQNTYYMNYNYYNPEGQYYSYYYSSAASSETQGNSTNAAAAVAQTAIMQAQAAKNLTAASVAAAVSQRDRTSQDSNSNSNQEYTVYPSPDVSTYQFDKTSGYYYDPSTGLYYDASSQYYYNSKTSQFMYWDAEKSTYLPAPTQPDCSTSDSMADTAEGAAVDKKEKEKDKKEKEKVKVAKKIAKDMEKWAKSMNAQKEALKEEQRKISIAAGRRESAAADAGFAILQKSKEDMKLMPPPPMGAITPVHDDALAPSPAVTKPGLVASYGGDSDDSGEEEDGGGVVDESKLVDWNKLACLLCKRQFQSKEILTKHTQFSDLHKQNLENFKGSAGSSIQKKEYRDRARERRQKYGTPAPPEPKKNAEVEVPVVYEQPTKLGIGTDNIGNKLLQKMGWSAGQGLGKANQGRTAPVETTRRAASAGLGARGANLVAEEGATYKDCVKKTMFARFHDIE